MNKVLYGFIESNITIVDGKECHRIDYFKGFDASTASFICTKIVEQAEVRSNAQHLANIHGITSIRVMEV